MLKNTTLFILLLIISAFSYAQKFASGYYNNLGWSNDQNNWIINYTTYEEYDDDGNILISRQFDKNGNIITERTYEYNAPNFSAKETLKTAYNGVLVNTSSTSYTYTSSNKLSSKLIQNWDTLINQWQNISLTSILYDNFDKETEYTITTFTNNIPDLISKREYFHTYNADKLISTYEHFTSTLSGTVYQSDTISRTLYKYNQKNLLTEATFESKDNSTANWEKRYREEYFYEYEKVNKIIHYTGNQSNNWQLGFMLDSISWYSDNIRNRYVLYNWNPITNLLEFDKKYIREYYFNTKSYNDYFITDFDKNNIKDTTKVQRVLYDENNNKVLDVEYNYIKGGTLIPYYGDRYLYVYSSNLKVIDYTIQSVSSAQNSFVNVYRKQLLTATNVVNHKKENIIKVYPNPSSGQLHIDFNTLINKDETLIIYDINGRLIQEYTLPPLTKNYTINNLTEGMYILKFRDITEMLIVTGN